MQSHQDPLERCAIYNGARSRHLNLKITYVIHILIHILCMTFERDYNVHVSSILRTSTISRSSEDEKLLKFTQDRIYDEDLESRSQTFRNQQILKSNQMSFNMMSHLSSEFYLNYLHSIWYIALLIMNYYYLIQYQTVLHQLQYNWRDLYIDL